MRKLQCLWEKARKKNGDESIEDKGKQKDTLHNVVDTINKRKQATR